MISLFKVRMSEDAGDAVERVLNSGYVAQGPKVDQFEKRIACDYFEKAADVKSMVTVNSGTSALELAIYMALRKEWGGSSGHVISTPMTCAATNLPILHNGRHIVWADIDPDTMNIDLNDVQWKLDESTAALVVVHFGGRPIDYQKLTEISQRFNDKYGRQLPVIEDCAHAWGSNFNGTPVGDVCGWTWRCFSMQAIKLLTTGDGGLLIPPSDCVQDARALRWFGLDRDNNIDFRSVQDIELPGFKYQMNDIAATIGLANLMGIHDAAESAALNARQYLTEIRNPAVKLPPPCDSSSWWLYPVIVEDANNFIEYLRGCEIESSPVHRPNDELAVFEGSKDRLPNLDSIRGRYTCIPVGWWLRDAEVAHVIDSVNKYKG